MDGFRSLRLASHWTWFKNSVKVQPTRRFPQFICLFVYYKEIIFEVLTLLLSLFSYETQSCLINQKRVLSCSLSNFQSNPWDIDA